MSNYDSTEEDELGSEYTSNSSSPRARSNGRYSSGIKRIDKQVKKKQRSLILFVTVLLISLLLTAFVYMRNMINEAGAAYYIKVNEVQATGLELSFDPNFDKNNGYDTLKGLGYENTKNTEGGSLLQTLGGINTTMFDMFKNIAEDENYTPANRGEYDTSAAYLSDQYYANKFFIQNNADVSNNQTLYYRIRVKFTVNKNNAIDAIRFMYVNNVDDGTPVGTYEYHILATPVKDGETYLYENKYDESGKLVKDCHELAAVPRDTNPLSTNFKNPNSGHEKEDWYCTNMSQDSEGYWYWASYDVELGYTEIYSLEPNKKASYTICAWLEASDPDHTDKILNGSVSFVLYFDVMTKDSNGNYILVS